MTGSYNIYHTSDASRLYPITITDNTYNTTSTSITFPGRDSAYGQVISEDLLQMLENFSGTSSPVNPTQGQLWFNTTIGVNQLMVYTGTSWVSVSGVYTGMTAPTAVLNGSLWFSTSSQQLFVYTGTTWVLIGPNANSSNTGAITETILDTSNASQNVLTCFVNSIRILIISSATAMFTPKLTIPGFSVINPGLNFSTAYSYLSSPPAIGNTSPNSGNFTSLAASSLDVSGLIVGKGITQIGSIMLYTNSTLPAGWLLCNGASVSISLYSTLYSIIGTTFGPTSSGNFTLPVMTAPTSMYYMIYGG